MDGNVGEVPKGHQVKASLIRKAPFALTSHPTGINYLSCNLSCCNPIPSFGFADEQSGRRWLVSDSAPRKWGVPSRESSK